MTIVRRRVPKLAITGLLLAGCGDDGSAEELFVEEIDALVTEFCIIGVECYGDGDEFTVDHCRFDQITELYGTSLINDSSDCDEAIVDWLSCAIDAHCDEEETCGPQFEALQRLCPKDVSSGP